MVKWDEMGRRLLNQASSTIHAIALDGILAPREARVRLNMRY